MLQNACILIKIVKDFDSNHRMFVHIGKAAIENMFGSPPENHKYWTSWLTGSNFSRVFEIWKNPHVPVGKKNENYSCKGLR